MENNYDFLIVGAGLYGCVCARELVKRGFKVLVIEKRNHIGGNCAVKTHKGVVEHIYGPHIFHTDNKATWDYLNDIEPFVPYRHKVIVVNNGLQYDFPINRNTLNKVLGYGRKLPQRDDIVPQNFEEAAIGMIGKKLYNLFYRDYTAKQWGCDPKVFPAEILTRVPVREDCNNEYFNDKYMGVFSSNRIFLKLLKGATVKLNCAFDKSKHSYIAKKTIYTGMIDEYKNYCYGELPYRSLRFEKRKVKPFENQGIAVINYTDTRPYTRTTEYGYMYNEKQVGGDRWYEYPVAEYVQGKKVEPYYPMPTEQAQALYKKYFTIASRDDFRSGCVVYFGGRLGSYKYLNMDIVVEQALELIDKIC